MRRDPALQDLSRDHHALLLLAHTLRGAAGDPDRALAALRAHAAVALLHFQEEETLVFPHLPAPESATLLAQHDGFRKALRELAVGGRLDPGRLGGLGEALQAHIRAEEAAFDRLQRQLGPAQTAELGESLLAFRRRHRPGAIGPGACDIPGAGG